MVLVVAKLVEAVVLTELGLVVISSGCRSLSVFETLVDVKKVTRVVAVDVAVFCVESDSFLVKSIGSSSDE